MIRSKTTTADVTLDALSLWGDIGILQGSIVQTYKESTDDYVEDRRYNPLVLMGNISVHDPAGVVGSSPEISDIEWYSGMPQKLADGSDDKVTNRIQTDPSTVSEDPDVYRNIDYLISDGSDKPWCVGVPKYGLIVHKNVGSFAVQPIYAIIKFVDVRTGIIVKRQCSISLTTEYDNDSALTMTGTRGEAWVADPINFKEPETVGNDITQEAWLRSIGAQLKQRGVDVADSKACYKWVVRDMSLGNNEWRDFNAAENGTLLRSAVNTKSLTLDLRYVTRDITVRCYACEREEGEAWSNPVREGSPYYECRINLEFNKELHVKVIQKAGFDQPYEMNVPCTFDISLVYGGKFIPNSGKDGLFNITWRAINLQTFQIVTLGTGKTVTFTPSMLGFSYNYGYGVYAEVKGYKTMQNGTAVYGDVITRSKTFRWVGTLESLTIWGELNLLQGSTTQVYSESDKEYHDDRAIVPCVLMGTFSVHDPQGVVSSAPSIYGIEWYDGMPQKMADGTDDYSTHRIKNPDPSVLADPTRYTKCDYLISDGSDSDWCKGVPRFGLIIHKNVQYLTTQPIYAVLKFIDTRTGAVVRKQCCINLNTEYLDDDSYNVVGDKGEEYAIDPLGIEEPKEASDIMDEPWLRTVTAQMRQAGESIDDDEVSYLWVIKDNNTVFGWRDFSEEEEEIMLHTSPKNKALTIDMRFAAPNIAVRCYAMRKKESAPWENPMDETSPYYECNLKVTLNDVLVVKALNTKGLELTPSMNDTFEYVASLVYGGKTVPNNKFGLFQIIWKGIDLKTLHEKVLGAGKTISFKPNEFGFSYPEGFKVYCEVGTLKTLAIVKDGDNIVVDVIDPTAVVVSPVFE